MARIPVFLLLPFMLISLKGRSQLHFKPLVDTSYKKITLMVLPQKFYNNHPGFFCKKEVQLQTALHLNLFMRLGSKEYTDKLEGKK
ncbi:MAG: hypothetical protein ACJ748_08955 [Flavisolibacter sp.]